MPDPTRLLKAELREIEWTEDREVRDLGKVIDVQFNPATLKVSYTNQKAGGDQPGGGSIQFVGSGTTKLSVELVFDVTVAEPPEVDGARPDDVRRLTAKVAHFMIPQPVDDNFVQRGVRFHWGTFVFEGVMDSMNETLEFFSADGRPLRASVTVEMSQQEIKDFTFGEAGVPGTESSRPLEDGESIHDAAGLAGDPEQWRDTADAVEADQELETPRLPPAGARVPAGPRR
ncbi:MAG: peptidoglycan-binding protein [Deltaproteobacteria bacterium]|nr:peptidoglycan-binding protein [Deltaproteobacteria bacterium]